MLAAYLNRQNLALTEHFRKMMITQFYDTMIYFRSILLVSVLNNNKLKLKKADFDPYSKRNKTSNKNTFCLPFEVVCHLFLPVGKEKFQGLKFSISPEILNQIKRIRFISEISNYISFFELFLTILHLLHKTTIQYCVYQYILQTNMYFIIQKHFIHKHVMTV